MFLKSKDLKGQKVVYTRGTAAGIVPWLPFTVHICAICTHTHVELWQGDISVLRNFFVSDC